MEPRVGVGALRMKWKLGDHCVSRRSFWKNLFTWAVSGPWICAVESGWTCPQKVRLPVAHEYKALGVQHNAGQQGLGLLALQVRPVVQDVIGPAPCHQLHMAGGGVGIEWKAEGEGFFDIGGVAPGGRWTMTHDYGAPESSSSGNLGLFRAVGVHPPPKLVFGYPAR